MTVGLVRRLPAGISYNSYLVSDLYVKRSLAVTPSENPNHQGFKFAAKSSSILSCPTTATVLSEPRRCRWKRTRASLVWHTRVARNFVDHLDDGCDRTTNKHTVPGQQQLIAHRLLTRVHLHFSVFYKEESCYIETPGRMTREPLGDVSNFFVLVSEGKSLKIWLHVYGHAGLNRTLDIKISNHNLV